MSKKTKVKIEPITFRKNDHIAVRTRNSPEVDAVLREYYNAKWSTGYRLWHLPYSDETFKALKKDLKRIAFVDVSSYANYSSSETCLPVKIKRKRIKAGKPSIEQQQKIDAFIHYYLREGHSKGTAKIYKCLLNVFFGWLSPKQDEEILAEDIAQFLDNYIEKNNFSTSYKRLMTNALKRYFDSINRSELFNP